MNMQNKSIQVKGLQKSYKKIHVLKGVDFEVEKGSIFALLGSNGAGKTTAIKILSTLIKPDQGSAEVCGFDVVRQPDQVREEISLTGQNAAVDGVLTGRENLRMIGKLRHLPDVNTKADALLERFDLLEAADRRVATYSGGMRRRLDLSMSLLGTPSVVFLDEPTTGLDPQSRITMWKIIKDLAHSGITVFLTTQYLDEADQLADQISILNQGKIVAEGTASELKKLLPHGHIELKFRHEKDLRTAHHLLGDYKASVDGENQALIVTTDGSIKQMTDILNQLQTAGLSVAEFAQKLPTLEDVFLTIIGENPGEEEAK
jgi:ABC-2 type transport system ATP-binding protein